MARGNQEATMPILPLRTLDLLEFCERRAPTWSTSAASLGLSAAESANFVSATAAARAAHTAQQVAIEAARVATAAAKDAVRRLRRVAGDDLRTIRAYAEQQPRPLDVYNLAQVPPPAARAPLPPPGTPAAFAAGLNTDGSVTIRWRCRNPTGSGAVVYTIRRRIGEAGTLTLIDTVGRRRYTDTSIPAGAGRVEYVVTATRGRVSGARSSPFAIMFGVEGGGVEGGGGVGEMAGVGERVGIGAGAAGLRGAVAPRGASSAGARG